MTCCLLLVVLGLSALSHGLPAALHSTPVLLHTHFDLEIRSKTPDEGAYHSAVAPTLTLMINDPSLISFRALHPLINSPVERSQAIVWQYANYSAWTAFQREFHLQYLTLTSFWKNLYQCMWFVVAHSSKRERETWEGRFFHQLSIYLTARPNTKNTFDASVEALRDLFNTIAAVPNKDAFYIEASAAVDALHTSTYDGALFLEFDTFKGTNAFLHAELVASALAKASELYVVSVSHYIGPAPVSGAGPTS